PQESLRVENRHVDLNHNRWVFPQSEAKCKKGPRIVYLTDEALAVTKRLYEPKRPHQRLFRNSADRPWTTEAINCFFDRLQERMGKQALKDAGYEVPPKEIDRMIAKLNPTCLVKGTLHTKSKAELKAEAKRKLLRTKARSAAPRYCLYALRHSWATNALKAGVDALTVAILMGHRDPSMLARTYQHLGHSPEHMFQQAQKAVGKLQ
ncbi:MAG: tyrosine-type recombinase/integrase, partial [Bdellovibrionales bacterium]|nr:tyrosine-type recombinase/integrase [Bdellovibrionales bacterium]